MTSMGHRHADRGPFAAFGVRPAWSNCLSLLVLLACACARATPGTSGGTGGRGSIGSGGATEAGGSGGATGTGVTGSGGTSDSGGVTGTGGAAPGMTGGAAGGGAGRPPATGSGGAGNGGGAGRAGTMDHTPDGGMSDRVCQMAQLKFDPKIPTVFVLVDRSGTVFTNDTTGIFFTLRSAVLEVVQRLQGEVRFGLGVFTGESGKMCPIFDQVPAALNNHTAMAALYNRLGRPQFKADTPAVHVLPIVKRSLLADTAPGDKYVLFVTDSETDYCNDGNQLCPVDSVTYLIQDLYASGIGTFVLGLPSDASSYSTAALRAFANAGAGLPVAVAAPGTTGGATPTPTDVYNQCQGDMTWRSIWTMAGRTGTVPSAIYQGAGGAGGGAGGASGAAGGGSNATVYTPNPNDKNALVDAISKVLSGVKSCVFDLGNVNGQSIKVDLTQLDKAKVLVMGAEIPHSETNGWHMRSANELELVGSACERWRMPNIDIIDFQFPCGTIIFE